MDEQDRTSDSPDSSGDVVPAHELFPPPELSAEDLAAIVAGFSSARPLGFIRKRPPTTDD